MQFRICHLIGIAAACGLLACGGGDDDPVDPVPVLEAIPPTQTELVASGNFEGPMDAVSSPDGETFYFSAHLKNPGAAETTAALFSVPSAGGTAQIMSNEAVLENPSGLVMSCDGTTLYIAELSYQSADAELEEDEDKSALYTLDIASQTLTPLTHEGIGEAAGLAFDKGCESLYVTGYTLTGQPALFTLPPAGGTAAVVVQGEPLQSPSGVYVDGNNVAWVMDHQPSEQLGGALFSVQPSGETGVVLDGLSISEPAGVSLVAGGDIAVIPSRDIDGNGQLLTVSTSDGQKTTTVAAADILEPAGIRTASQKSIMAVVDADGDAIYRAQ